MGTRDDMALVNQHAESDGLVVGLPTKAHDGCFDAVGHLSGSWSPAAPPEWFAQVRLTLKLASTVPLAKMMPISPPIFRPNSSATVSGECATDRSFVMIALIAGWTQSRAVSSDSPA